MHLFSVQASFGAIHGGEAWEAADGEASECTVFLQKIARLFANLCGHCSYAAAIYVGGSTYVICFSVR